MDHLGVDISGKRLTAPQRANYSDWPCMSSFLCFARQDLEPRTRAPEAGQIRRRLQCPRQFFSAYALERRSRD